MVTCVSKRSQNCVNCSHTELATQGSVSAFSHPRQLSVCCEPSLATCLQNLFSQTVDDVWIVFLPSSHTPCLRIGHPRSTGHVLTTWGQGHCIDEVESRLLAEYTNSSLLQCPLRG